MNGRQDKVRDTVQMPIGPDLYTAKKPEKSSAFHGFASCRIILLFFAALALSAQAATEQNTSLSIPAHKARKLVDSQYLLSGFVDPQSTVPVIVNLFEPSEARQKDLWKSRTRRSALRDKIRDRQLQVLSAFAGSEFHLRHNFDNLAAFSGEVTIEGLNRLLDDPAVRSIEPDYIEQMHLAQGIPLIEGTTYRSIYDGTGVAVGIVDTGVDYTHPRLGGGGFPNSKVIGGYNFGDDNSDPMPNGQAHGTCCAGIAAGDLGTYGDYIGGVAPGAKIYALKITAGSGTTANSSDIIAAWDWCITNQYNDPCNPILVISLSFGGGRYYSDCDGSGSEEIAYANAADRAEAAGITIFASSGNDGYCDSIARPACISNIISVGAVYDTDFGIFQPCINAASCAIKYSTGGCSTGWYAIDTAAADMVTSYSNTASFLDIFAPSNQAYTTDLVSGGYYSGNYYPYFGGTSAACPYAAGAVACLQSAAKAVDGNYLSPADVRDILTATGDPITDGKVAITKPRVNLTQAIETVVPVGPKPPVAQDVYTSTQVNTAVTIELIGSDDGLPDPPAALDYIVTSLPENGSLSDPNAAAIAAVPYTLTASGYELIYTPDSNYVGTDSFLYKVNDGGTEPNGGDSNLATVTINIIDTVIYTANMDTDPGWTLNADWQWGTPIGGGSHNYDPTSGYTGNNVIGYNLSGDYPNKLRNTRYATTGPIDCRGYENIVLSFYRWLGVESSSYDHANLQVSNNASTWTDVWVHSGSAISDSSWQYLEYNLPSAVVDNQQTVYLRWGMGTTSRSTTYPGWNIDDVELNGDRITTQQYTLTVSSTTGGSVTSPGEGSFQYNDGTVVDLNALPDTGYYFLNWTGDTSTVADSNAALTTITVDANYSIAANFAFSPNPPEITSTPVTTATVGQLYTYNVNANGTPAPTYSLTTSPNDMTIDVNSGLIEWMPAQQDVGPNVPVTVRATNSEGFDEQAFEIDVNGIAPVITSVPVTTASAGFLYSYDVDANGIPAPTYSLITSPNDMSIDVNSGLIEWTPSVADIGPNVPVTVRATNSQGSDDQSFQIDVAGIAPVIISTPITTATADSLYTYDVDANGVPAPTYSLITSPYDMTIDPNSGLIEWTPDYSDIDQNHPVTVEALNSEGSDIQNFQITILPADNFDDNARSAMWRILEDNYQQARIIEDQNRLEVRAPDANNIAAAVYMSNGWALDANEDFAIQADFHYTPDANAQGWVGLILENEQGYILLLAGADGNQSYYYYQTAVDGNFVGEQEVRDTNEGSLYIWYDVDSNNMYVSHISFDPEDAYQWQTVPDPLQQYWTGPADLFLGGGTTGGVLENGDAYLDNFRVIAGRLYNWPPVTDLNYDGFIDLADIALFTQDWLTDPNAPPDFDNDGTVNLTDFAELSNAW